MHKRRLRLAENFWGYKMTESFLRTLGENASSLVLLVFVLLIIIFYNSIYDFFQEKIFGLDKNSNDGKNHDEQLDKVMCTQEEIGTHSKENKCVKEFSEELKDIEAKINKNGQVVLKAEIAIQILRNWNEDKNGIPPDWKMFSDGSVNVSKEILETIQCSAVEIVDEKTIRQTFESGYVEIDTESGLIVGGKTLVEINREKSDLRANKDNNKNSQSVPPRDIQRELSEIKELKSGLEDLLLAASLTDIKATRHDDFTCDESEKSQVEQTSVCLESNDQKKSNEKIDNESKIYHRRVVNIKECITENTLDNILRFVFLSKKSPDMQLLPVWIGFTSGKNKERFLSFDFFAHQLSAWLDQNHLSLQPDENHVNDAIATINFLVKQKTGYDFFGDKTALFFYIADEDAKQNAAYTGLFITVRQYPFHKKSLMYDFSCSLDQECIESLRLPTSDGQLESSCIDLSKMFTHVEY